MISWGLLILVVVVWSFITIFIAYNRGLDRGHALGFHQGMQRGILVGKNRQNFLLSASDPAWLIKLRLESGDPETVDELVELAESDEP